MIRLLKIPWQKCTFRWFCVCVSATQLIRCSRHPDMFLISVNVLSIERNALWINKNSTYKSGLKHLNSAHLSNRNPTRATAMAKHNRKKHSQFFGYFKVILFCPCINFWMVLEFWKTMHNFIESWFVQFFFLFCVWFLFRRINFSGSMFFFQFRETEIDFHLWNNKEVFS